MVFLPWCFSQKVVIRGLVLGVEWVGIGNAPVGIHSLLWLLAECFIIGDIPLIVHPLLWWLVVMLGPLLGRGVASGF